MLSAVQAALQDPAGQAMFKNMAQQMGLGDVDPQAVLETLKDPRAQETMAQVTQALNNQGGGQLPPQLQSLSGLPSASSSNHFAPIPPELQQGPYGLGQFNPSAMGAKPQIGPNGVPGFLQNAAGLPNGNSTLNPGAATFNPRQVNRALTGLTADKQPNVSGASTATALTVAASGLLAYSGIITGVEKLMEAPKGGQSLVARAAIAIDHSPMGQSVNNFVKDSVVPRAYKKGGILSRIFGTTTPAETKERVRMIRGWMDPLKAQNVMRDNIIEVYAENHKPSTSTGWLQRNLDKWFNPEARAQGASFKRISTEGRDIKQLLGRVSRGVDAVEGEWLNETIRLAKAELAGINDSSFRKLFDAELAKLGPESAALKKELRSVQTYKQLQQAVLKTNKQGERLLAESVQKHGDTLLGNIGKHVDKVARNTLDKRTLNTLGGYMNTFGSHLNLLSAPQKAVYRNSKKVMDQVGKTKLGFVGESVIQFFSKGYQIFSGDGNAMVSSSKMKTAFVPSKGIWNIPSRIGNALSIPKNWDKLCKGLGKVGLKMTFPIAMFGTFVAAMPLWSAAKAESGDKTKTFFHHFFGMGLANLLLFDGASRLMSLDFMTKLPKKVFSRFPRVVDLLLKPMLRGVPFISKIPAIGGFLANLNPYTAAGYFLVMFALAEPMQKVGEKLAHKLFGKPESVKKAEAEEAAQQAEANGQPPLTQLNQDQLELSQQPQAIQQFYPPQAPEDKYPLRHYQSPSDISLTPEMISMSRAAQRDSAMQRHIFDEGNHLQSMIGG